MADKGSKKYFSVALGVKKGSDKKVSGSIDMTGMGGSSNIGGFSGNFTSLLIEAERVLMLIDDNSLTINRLSIRHRNLLYLYFYFINPIVNRIVNLHVTIPLSSMTLQKPKYGVDIVQDYVYNFFEKMIKRMKWSELIEIACYYYWIFGKSLVIIEDNGKSEIEVLIDEDNLMNKNVYMSEDVIKKIDDINTKYNIDNGSVSRKDIDFVLSSSLLNYNPNYKGVVNSRVLSPFEIIEVFQNAEIGWNVYSIPKSKYIHDYTPEGSFDTRDDMIKRKILDLKSIGYSESYLKANMNNDSNTVDLSNDSMDEDGIYIAEFSRPNICGIENSAILPILKDLIRYNKAMHSLDARLKLVNRKISIVGTDENVSEDQINTLNNLLMDGLSNEEGTVIAVNYSVSVDSVDFDVNDKLSDVDSVAEESKQNIIIGSGTPEALLTAEDSYGGSYLKLEVLNGEFETFRSAISRFIEEYIFRPVSLKRGFVVVDVMGNIVPIYPKVNFEVGSIIGTSEFKDMLKDLADDGKISNSRFLRYLGFDPEEMLSEIKKEKDIRSKMGLDSNDGGY